MAKHECISTAQLLIRLGASTNSTDDRNRTPLFTAIEAKNPDMVKVLLEHGADPNVRMAGGIFPSPLHCAIQSDSLSAAEALLEHSPVRVDVNSTNALRLPILHVLLRNHVDALPNLDVGKRVERHEKVSRIMRLIAEHGGDMSDRGRPMTTPLHIAAGIEEPPFDPSR